LGLILAAFPGLVLLLGMLVAFTHLGIKRNAWRMLYNLKKSWLSKEILFMGLFGLSLLSSKLINVPLMDWLTAFLGFGLIYSMANVYYLRSLPGWNTWRTFAAFLLSALLLGLFFLFPVLLYASYLSGLRLISVGYISWFGLFSTPALVCELLLLYSVKWEDLHMTNSIRVTLILLVMVGAIIASQLPASVQGLSFCILFLLLLIEESIGRWLFYGQLSKRNL
jgi:DMSO reductase anchor subunit